MTHQQPTCPHCDTPFEPGFEVCWNCGGTLDRPPPPGFGLEDVAPVPRVEPRSSRWTWYVFKWAVGSFAASAVLFGLTAAPWPAPVRLALVAVATMAFVFGVGAVVACVVLCFMPLRAVHHSQAEAQAEEDALRAEADAHY